MGGAVLQQEKETNLNLSCSRGLACDFESTEAFSYIDNIALVLNSNGDPRFY